MSTLAEHRNEQTIVISLLRRNGDATTKPIHNGSLSNIAGNSQRREGMFGLSLRTCESALRRSLLGCE
jgi:hypothetical protein